MRRNPDIEVDIRMLSAEDGGRTSPAFSGYRPNHMVKPDYLTSGTHHYTHGETIAPGKTGRGTITFISPEAYPHCLSVGQVIRVQEGGRLVGTATIVRVLNPLLLAPAQAHDE